PRVLFNAGLDYRFWDNSVVFSSNFRHVAGQRDSSVELDDYQVLDVSLRWAATEHVDLFVRAENAFDEDYQEVSSYNSSGAAVYAGFKLSL
ncbi:MAG: TonB-dependent receptor, partial [Cellvibrionaceae bacterium]|nr:TonB-dependent receptor [Cellvibrionaceae bacterium]